MRLIGLPLCGCLLLADPLAAVQSPVRLSAADVAPAVWGVVELPQGTGPHPGAVVLHAAVARGLADSGFVTLALDYYTECS